MGKRTEDKGGRPLVPINWIEFDKLAALQATLEEIADWFGCSVDTIERACKREKNMGFAEYRRLKASKGKISLRRLQWQTAAKGNATMQIWLGKQELGQRDRFPEDEERERPPAVVNITFGRAKKPVQVEKK